MDFKTSKAEVGSAILDVTKRLYDRGFNSVLSGNISGRISVDRMLITPSALDKYRISENELSLMDIGSGTPESIEGPKPSSEFRVHARIYQAMPEVNAVVHPHPTYSLAMVNAMGSDAFVSVLEQKSEEYGYYVGKLRSQPWMKAGTPEIANKVAESVMDGATVVIMEDHGTVAIGKTLHEALGRAESLEIMAKRLYIEKQMETMGLLKGAGPSK